MQRQLSRTVNWAGQLLPALSMAADSSQLPPIIEAESYETIKKNNVAIYKLELIIIFYYYLSMMYVGRSTCHITHVEAVGKPWSQPSHLTFPWVLEIKPGSSGLC